MTTFKIVGCKFAVVTIAASLAGCGTFQLASNIQSTGKTAEQQQLDTLSCKDQAKLAANTAERQVGAFLLGMTVVGTPLAFEIEKAKQREVFASCMTARGYIITPPKDGVGTATTSVPQTLVKTLANGSTVTRTSAGALSYPAKAAEQRIVGVLLMSFDVPVNGVPTNIYVLSRNLSKDGPEVLTVFDEVATKFVQESRFRVEGYQNSSQIARFTQPFYFRLDDVSFAPLNNLVATSATLVRSPSEVAAEEPKRIAPAPAVVPPQQVSPALQSAPKDEAQQLTKLKDLRERNLITEAEYAAKRKAILDGL